MTSQRYERKQSPLWLATISYAVGNLIAFLPHSDTTSKFAGFGIVFLGFVVSYFSYLRLVVDDESVRWYVGGGWPRGYISLIRIERVERIELGFFEGWRAHWTIWQGWRWSILRFQAVEIITRDGTRTMLGTRAPNALFNAIVERQRLSA